MADYYRYQCQCGKMFQSYAGLLEHFKWTRFGKAAHTQGVKLVPPVKVT
jgi:hypothetical protein